MELNLVRHGEGEHTSNVPASLHKKDPHLTSAGKKEAEKLRHLYSLEEGDLLLASPLTRTLETASIWTKGSDCRRVTTPLVGPRMFPQLKN
ncbi:histidine phosphatase family protein [Halobacillus salinarum]|uniref:Histidine phosphatase family protein n=1 Tax=Halobacillus salinarum TaxID=2932257 RepID=A0ABY4EGN8_9BACI|nr:histidine phosphatase family protein [Halobacillus salinarum]UOQ42602.1 histidine phosphatase family protein [Halobacillus salinarum]